jgi:hypothetical protein
VEQSTSCVVCGKPAPLFDSPRGVKNCSICGCPGKLRWSSKCLIEVRRIWNDLITDEASYQKARLEFEKKAEDIVKTNQQLRRNIVNLQNELRDKNEGYETTAERRCADLERRRADLERLVGQLETKNRDLVAEIEKLKGKPAAKEEFEDRRFSLLEVDD